MALLILLCTGVYAAIGVAFGLAFIVSGAPRIDQAAAGAPWSFRLLIWPGAAALWPILLPKWLRAAHTAREHRS